MKKKKKKRKRKNKLHLVNLSSFRYLYYICFTIFIYISIECHLEKHLQIKKFSYIFLEVKTFCQILSKECFWVKFITLNEENVAGRNCCKSCKNFLLLLNKNSGEINVVKVPKSECRGNLKWRTDWNISSLFHVEQWFGV